MLSIDLRLEGAKELDGAIAALRRTLEGGDFVRDVGRALTSRARADLQALTPRPGNTAHAPGYRHRSSVPLWRQWTTEVHQTPGSYVATIYNKASKHKGGLAALAAVEFGSRPHTMFSERGMVWLETARVRRFNYSANERGGRASIVATGDIVDIRGIVKGAGGKVFAHHVNHPGMSGFGMVMTTHRRMQGILDSFVADLSRQFGALWDSGGVASIGVTYGV